MNVNQKFNIFSRNLRTYLCTKFDFPWIIREKSELSTNYTAERHAFPRIILGKSKLSVDYTAERHVIANYSE
jgi:hypothetical protein